MTWKDILKQKKLDDMTDEEIQELLNSKKYEDMTDEEQAIIRRLMEVQSEEGKKAADIYNAQFFDEQLEAINERIRRDQATSDAYFGLREMADIAGVEFPEGKRKK